MKTVILMSLLVVLAGCNDSRKNQEFDAQSFTPHQLRMVEERAGISIPSGSRGLNLYDAQAEVDPSFIAKIWIPTASTNEIVTEIERLPSQSISVTNYLVNRVTWWHPAAASTRIERRFFQLTGDFVSVLLCEEDSQTILYVDWASR
jgi:hypothetical protein